MNTFNILHLSDLHIGHEKVNSYYSNMRDIFYKDLKDMSEYVDKYDLILFSGDLTYSGEKDQYEKLTTILSHLYEYLNNELNCDPYFISVPGNHDLQRPEEQNSVKIAIENKYYEFGNFYNNFWENFDNNEYGNLIKNCFIEYSKWNENINFPKFNNLTSGLLPGDFSCSINNDNVRIGIIGLNSAFLQLSDGNYKEKLDINPRQLMCLVSVRPRK